MTEATPHRPEKSRLRGTLLDHFHAKKIGAVPLARSETSIEPQNIDGIPVELGPESRVKHLESGGTAVTNAILRNFWHISHKSIDEFTSDKGTSAASKLGPGTYVGYGPLPGDRVELLKDGSHVRHDIELHGNFLLVPVAEQDDVSWEVAAGTVGDDDTAVTRMAPGKRLNALLRQHPFDGAQFDGFIFYAPSTEPGGQWAEGVVINPTPLTIPIVDRHAIE